MENIKRKRSHPGVFLKDELEAMNMSAKEFSIRTGISERVLSSILNCERGITYDVAYKLAVFYDHEDDPELWLRLQNSYELWKIECVKSLEKDKEFELIKKIKEYLIKEGIITNEDGKDEIIDKVRSYAKVSNISNLKDSDSLVFYKKETKSDESNRFYQNFWTALALNKAREIEVCPYSKTKLMGQIGEIKALILKKPEEFVPKLREIFEKCGISFVLLPYLPKSNLYGATKWLNSEKVMLAVSDGGGDAKTFWFSLFHEISHVIMAKKRVALLNIVGITEKESDEMAFNMLIPPSKWADFKEKEDFLDDSIEKFAEKMGILPCLVLERLKKEGITGIPYGKYEKKFDFMYKNLKWKYFHEINCWLVTFMC